MGRAFVYVILGGGVAAGYAALEFSKAGIARGELCIISEEPIAYLYPEPERWSTRPILGQPEKHDPGGWWCYRQTPLPYLEIIDRNSYKVAPYERPALSKGYLFPEDPARPPSFHTCVGANEERLTPKWYKEHGIELVLGTRVKSADVRRKTLLTAAGETISYKILIIATGARVLKLEEFGIHGSNAENVCYLRNLADATQLVTVMQSCVGGNAVVIGGGYIGMECAASLLINKINVTMVFPEADCMARLFTPKIARFYEDFYKSRGVRFLKGTVLSSFENDSSGKVTAVILRDGTRVSADMVVVGIGILPNTSLFEGQLTLEKGGIKVNGHMQTSDSSVYAVGDVAAFPVKLFHEIRRLEHVDSARKSAKHAVAAIMAPDKTGDFDYLPFFYSRVLTLSWQFYGDNVGQVVHYGDFSGKSFGAYWINNGQLVGSFLEGGTKEEYEAIAKVTRLMPMVEDISELERQGLDFALSVSRRPPPPPPPPPVKITNSSVGLEKPLYTWHATAGIVVATSIALFAYWYRRRRRRW